MRARPILVVVLLLVLLLGRSMEALTVTGVVQTAQSAQRTNVLLSFTPLEGPTQWSPGVFTTSESVYTRSGTNAAWSISLSPGWYAMRVGSIPRDVAVLAVTNGSGTVAYTQISTNLPLYVYPVAPWDIGGGSGGVTDHGDLTGLSDDDHPQYYNTVRGDARWITWTTTNTFMQWIGTLGENTTNFSLGIGLAATNKANAIGLATTNLANSKQHGSANLTNWGAISGITVIPTNAVSDSWVTNGAGLLILFRSTNDLTGGGSGSYERVEAGSGASVTSSSVGGTNVFTVSATVDSASSNAISSAISNQFRLDINTPLPKTGVAWFIGDSQTAGGNTLTTNYTDGAGSLLPAYRWTSHFATNGDRTLTISNLGIGGTRTGWLPTDANSHFNKLGQVPLLWTNVMTMMNDYNNWYLERYTTDEFYESCRRNEEAMIGRAFIHGFVGLSTTGMTDTATSPVAGWGTSGTDSGFATTTRSQIPFYPSGYTVNQRHRISLANGQTNTFLLTNKRAIGLFFDTSTNGGTFSVSVNGRVVGNYSTYFQSFYQYPRVVWLENPPTNATVLITATSGAGLTNHFLAAGFVNHDTNGAIPRHLLVSSIPNQTSAEGTTERFNRSANQTYAAVGTFRGYPVKFVNMFEATIPALHQDPREPDHFNGAAAIPMARAFLSAQSVPAFTSPNWLDLRGLFETNTAASTGGSTATNSPITTGPSVVSTTSNNVPFYSISAAAGFTNVAARPGQRFKGINLVLRSGQDWYEYYSNPSFFHFVTNDIALAKALGFNAVRLISDQKAVYTNAISQSLMISRYEFFVKHAGTNGLDVYACAGDGNRYLSPPTGSELLYASNYTYAFSSMLSSNSNVRGLDIFQEIHPWDTDTTELSDATNAVRALYQASKLGAPNIAASFSISLNSGNLAHTDVRDKLVQLVDTTCDFNDLHIYLDPYPGTLYWMTNFTKPFILGEVGVNNSLAPTTQDWKYRHAVSLASHPQCEGVFFWALTDQDTTAANMWGWYLTNGTLKASNYVFIGRSVPAQRNTPWTVYLGNTDGPNEQISVSGGNTTNAGTYYFRTSRPARMEIAGSADVNPTVGGLVVVGSTLTALNGYGYQAGSAFTMVHGSTASGQRLTAAGSGDFQFTPGTYELRFFATGVGVGQAAEIYTPQSNAKTRFTYDTNP